MSNVIDFQTYREMRLVTRRETVFENYFDCDVQEFLDSLRHERRAIGDLMTQYQHDLENEKATHQGWLSVTE